MRLLIIPFAIVMLQFSCNEKRKIEKIQPYLGPMIHIEDVVTIYTDSAVQRVKLQAPVQNEFENGDRKFPKGVYIEFYTKEGVKETTLKANQGKYIKRQNLYTAIGNVEIENILEHNKLNTEELNWSPGRRKIYTDKFVIIKTPQQTLQGHDLEANQEFTWYKLNKPSGFGTLE